MFVPLRTVPLCLLWCPRSCLFGAALTSTCGTRHSRVGWAPSAFPWTAPQKAVWVPLPSETQHHTRSSRTLARSSRRVEASSGFWGLSALPPSEFSGPQTVNPPACHSVCHLSIHLFCIFGEHAPCQEVCQMLGWGGETPKLCLRLSTNTKWRCLLGFASQRQHCCEGAAGGRQGEGSRGPYTAAPPVTTWRAKVSISPSCPGPVKCISDGRECGEPDRPQLAGLGVEGQGRGPGGPGSGGGAGKVLAAARVEGRALTPWSHHVWIFLVLFTPVLL